MKKLEKLNSSLFKSLESSKMSSLNTIMGGTYEQWTGKEGNRDSETHTGAKGCDSADDTKKKDDVTKTADCADHDYLQNNNDILTAVAVFEDTLIAS